MRKKNFNKSNLSYELQVIKALNDRTATKEMIDEVVTDVQKHLDSNIVATLDNYCGRFTKAGLKALQDNYNIFDADKIKTEKSLNVMKILGEKIIKDKPLKLHTSVINLVMDYIRNKNTDDTSTAAKYVIVGYPSAQTGSRTDPEPISTDN